jgi:hypothetical protein
VRREPLADQRDDLLARGASVGALHQEQVAAHLGRGREFGHLAAGIACAPCTIMLPAA